MTVHKSLLVRREAVLHPASGHPITVGLSRLLPSGRYAVEVRYGERILRTEYPPAHRFPLHAMDVLEWLAMIVNYDLRDREHYLAARGLPDTAETREEYRAHRSLLTRMRAMLGDDFAEFRFHDWALERYVSGPGALIWEREESVFTTPEVRKMRAGGHGKS